MATHRTHRAGTVPAWATVLRFYFLLQSLTINKWAYKATAKTELMLPYKHKDVHLPPAAVSVESSNNNAPTSFTAGPAITAVYVAAHRDPGDTAC